MKKSFAVVIAITALIIGSGMSYSKKPEKYKEVAVSNGGSISGAILFKGNIPDAISITSWKQTSVSSGILTTR